MEYICDAPGDRTWFRLVSEGEAVMESEVMRHAVEKYFRREWEKASKSFKPLTSVFFEQDIGLAAHIQREMPFFLTLRDEEGTPLVTAMLPSGGRRDRSFGLHHRRAGQYRSLQAARRCDRALAEHFDMPLDRAHCYPYRGVTSTGGNLHGLHARAIRRPSVTTRWRPSRARRAARRSAGLVRKC